MMGFFFDIYSMCGIAGIINREPQTGANSKNILLQKEYSIKYSGLS